MPLLGSIISTIANDSNFALERLLKIPNLKENSKKFWKIFYYRKIIKNRNASNLCFPNYSKIEKTTFILFGPLVILTVLFSFIPPLIMSWIHLYDAIQLTTFENPQDFFTYLKMEAFHLISVLSILYIQLRWIFIFLENKWKKRKMVI